MISKEFFESVLQIRLHHIFYKNCEIVRPFIIIRNINSGHLVFITTVYALTVFAVFEQMTLLVKEIEDGDDVELRPQKFIMTHSNNETSFEEIKGR